MRFHILVLVTLSMVAAACGSPQRSQPTNSKYVGDKLATAHVTLPPGSTASVSGTATPSAPPSAAVRIVSVTDGHPGSNATVSAETAPGTQCSIQYRHPSGKLSTTKGLTTRVSDASGAVSWTFRIDSTTKPGRGDIAVTCGGAAAYRVINIISP